MPIHPGRLAIQVANFALAKKATDVVRLDLRGLADYTDYLIIATGSSPSHVRAIADHIDEQMEERGVRARSREGLSNLRWVILDYVDIVVHVFDPASRNYYDLDRLWGDAPRMDFEDDVVEPVTRATLAARVSESGVSRRLEAAVNRQIERKKAPAKKKSAGMKPTKSIPKPKPKLVPKDASKAVTKRASPKPKVKKAGLRPPRKAVTGKAVATKKAATRISSSKKSK